ncbi:MAG: alpha/beta hydrolase [Candidatus Spechtbacterales bacterium]
MSEKYIGENKIYTSTHTPKELKHETPLFLVHGSWGGSFMWKVYIEYFVNQGRKVVTIDLRGHGKSGGTVEGATMDDYVVDMHQVIKNTELQNPILVGHSMAGLLVLMYGAKNNSSAIVSIDPSQSIEVQKESMDKEYKSAYTPMDAGMPGDPQKVMQAFPDISKEMLLKMKDMLGVESGVARSQRKKGVSVPKELLDVPILFVAGELGDSVPFGIGIEKTREMAKYYESDLVEIGEATHPGILMGEHAKEAAKKINDWLNQENL